jgi:hypothetical protein
MKLIEKLATGSIAVMLVLSIVGCSGSSDSSSNLSGTEVPITDENDAKLAITAIESSIQLGSEDLTEYTETDDIPHASASLAIALAPVNKNISCQRYGQDTDGTFTAVGDISGTSSRDMTYTYDDCWISDNNRLNGKKTLQATATDEGFITANIATTDYSLVGEYIMNTSVVAKFYRDETPPGMDILINGKINVYNGEEGVTYASVAEQYTKVLGFENFSYKTDENEDETMNGKVSITNA